MVEDITGSVPEEIIEYVTQLSLREINKHRNDSGFVSVTDFDLVRVLSIDTLKEHMERPHSFFNCSRDELNKINLRSQMNVAPMIGFLQKSNPDSNVTQSGDFLYSDNNGYMGWHTNADAAYERVYFTYSETGDSYFNYYDYETDSIVRTKDNKGVTVRKFNVKLDENRFLWHCVESHCFRTSFGFRVIKKYV